jgi:hypothetical protein
MSATPPTASFFIATQRIRTLGPRFGAPLAVRRQRRSTLPHIIRPIFCEFQVTVPFDCDNIRELSGVGRRADERTNVLQGGQLNEG